MSERAVKALSKGASKLSAKASSRVAERVAQRMGRSATSVAKNIANKVTVAKTASDVASNVSEAVLESSMMEQVMDWLKSPIVLIGILVVAGLVYYFMVYRPQQEEAEERARRPKWKMAWRDESIPQDQLPSEQEIEQGALAYERFLRDGQEKARDIARQQENIEPQQKPLKRHHHKIPPAPSDQDEEGEISENDEQSTRPDPTDMIPQMAKSQPSEEDSSVADNSVTEVD